MTALAPLGIVLVVGGAEAFLDGLLAVAARYRLPAFALTVVVSGFEVENIAAGIAASLAGLPGAAAGTFLGGTVFLALGVAGLGAILAPIRTHLPRPTLLLTAISPLPLASPGLDGELSRSDGLLLLGWFVILMVGFVRLGAGVTPEEDADGETSRRWPLLWLLGGVAVLSLGGQLLGEGIRGVVLRLGVSDTLLGNTALAAAVEAEEVGRVAVPSRRGRGDLAPGNVAGTIAHFTAFNAGVIALVRPLPLDGATKAIHLPAAVAAPALLALVLALGKGIGRAAGIVLLLLYVAYVAAAIALG